MEGWIDECMDGGLDRGVDGYMGGGFHRGMDGWPEEYGWKNGQMVGIEWPSAGFHPPV